MTGEEHRLALPAGYQLDRYRFQGVLGAGGFGITYLAEDTNLHRKVAVKELLPGEIATRLDGATVVAQTRAAETSFSWARDRFLQEGRALAACDHPNVVHVYEMIEANGTAYMVTRYEDGRSFAEWLKECGGPPSESDLRVILMALLSGLEKVHAAGFLHRDLKPENIYLTDEGRPILLDFGSARQAVSDRTHALTSIVTSGYAPFEQYHEDGKQGPWTDIYALAGVMFRAIHGQKPPEATRRLKDDPCPLLANEHAGQYSIHFLRAIDRALSVAPARRPQTISEWRNMLVEPLHDLAPGTPWWKVAAARGAHLWDLARVHPVPAAAMALGMLMLGAVAWKMGHPRPNPIPPVAVVPPTPAPHSVAVIPTPVPPAVVPKPLSAPATPPPIAVATPKPISVVPATPAPATAPVGPQPGRHWVDTLGLDMVPLPDSAVHLAATATRRSDFETFIQETGYQVDGAMVSFTSKGWASKGATWNRPGYPVDPAQPIVGVNVYDALAFCHWLTERERKAGRLDGHLAYRLPTDDEWSAAAGGGTYGWGDAWPPPADAGNLAGQERSSISGQKTIPRFRDSFREVAPVGSFQPNAAGFYDLGSNVFEWCGTWFHQPAKPGLPEPTIAEEHSYLIQRGASAYDSDQNTLRLAHRSFDPPSTRAAYCGFRVAVAPENPATALNLPPPPAAPETPAESAKTAEPLLAEKRLVGIWEARLDDDSGPRIVHWEQESSGEYSLDGGPTEHGRLTAEKGLLSATADTPETIPQIPKTYHFKSNTLLATEGPLGAISWKKISSITTAAREAGAEEEKAKPTTHPHRDPPPESGFHPGAFLKRHLHL